MSTLNALLSTCQAEQAPLLARMMKRQASYAAMRDRFIVRSAIFEVISVIMDMLFLRNPVCRLF
ncbi:hypothetical protein RVV06_002494 [Enterobacter ludwigii]|nr:hypothetical protein [Enterobacter ludwigii]HDS6666506.1 hypothetical protein [Enterobacter ludwigii]